MRLKVALGNLTLRQRFMVAVGVGVVALVALVLVVIARYEEQAMERKLYELSANEMTSLHALIVNVMAMRPEDGDNIGVTVFNRWFDSRNSDYPGKVWSVWSDKVAAHMRDAEPRRAPKLPQDDIDREALQSGKTIARMVGSSYRYAMPIVLGVTEGAQAEVCFSCHGGMGLQSGEVIAVLSSTLSVEHERAQLHRTVLMLFAGGIVAAVAAVLGVRWVLGQVITRPIGRMISVMGRLADGDSTVQVDYQERRDEMGDMARAMEIFREHIIEADHLRAAQEQEREAATEERTAALRAMADEFDRTVKVRVAGVEAATSGIQHSAETMAARSERSGSRSLEVGQAAQITTSRCEGAAAATRELAKSVRDVSDQVEHSTRIAGEAVEMVGVTAQRMDELSNVVLSIDEIVRMIGAIAAKTNLLALNATIEAARAGEAGKGFAVVAHEVKDLATQTAKATEAISEQVAAIQNSAADMRGTIEAVVQTIRTMDEIGGHIAEVIRNQDAVAGAIAADIDEVATQAQRVSESVVHLAKSSAQSCAGTVRVIWCARSLAKVVDDLRVEAEQFLHSVQHSDQANTMELF